MLLYYSILNALHQMRRRLWEGMCMCVEKDQLSW
eukprot:UN06095